MSAIERIEDIYAYDECSVCGGLFNITKLKEIQPDVKWAFTKKICIKCSPTPTEGQGR